MQCGGVGVGESRTQRAPTHTTYYCLHCLHMQRRGTHLFVHLHVEAVGHLVILKTWQKTVELDDTLRVGRQRAPRTTTALAASSPLAERPLLESGTWRGQAHYRLGTKIRFKEGKTKRKKNGTSSGQYCQEARGMRHREEVLTMSTPRSPTDNAEQAPSTCCAARLVFCFY